MHVSACKRIEFDADAKSKSSAGAIHLIMGPMFSGKTTELLRRIRRQTFAKKRCLVIKYAKDTRYSTDKASTHDCVMHAATSASALYKVDDGLLDDVDVVGIDEGQFFDDVVTFAEDMANKGKTVIVAGLSGTYERKGFGSFLELLPLAEKVSKLSAICEVCHGLAHFTKRISDEKDVEVIGGKEKYIPVCRQCFAPSSSSGEAVPATTLVAARSTNSANPSASAPGAPSARLVAARRFFNGGDASATPPQEFPGFQTDVVKPSARLMAARRFFDGGDGDDGFR
jgi:thymidine kinase